MSRSIDERIVEMKFDNKQFEGGIKESLTSLQKLDDVLKKNISSKSLDDITKSASKIDISGLGKAIDTINDRFSTLGIVGMRVIENITDGLMGGLSRAVQSTTNSIVSGGVKRAMNIENAHFQLQGLISDEKEVQAIMKEANESVDGTAYSYDVAAKAASMFAASGIRSGEQMQNSLKGIAGVAATANADYERVANIFTKIAGQGRIMGDELNQFASMGMSASAALTNYMNGINDGSIQATDSVTNAVKEITNGVKITEGDLRDLVSDGVVSFEIFSEAMATTFGDHAKDANKTFTGAMANIRAALARTGAMFVTPLIAQDGPFVQFFNAIRVKVNEFNKALGATGGMAEKFTNWLNGIVTKLTPIVENFKVANVITREFGDGVEKTFETATLTMQKFGDGTEKLVARKVYTPFHALKDIVYTVINVFKGLHSVVKPVGEAFSDVFSSSLKAENLYILIENIRKLTDGLRLSEGNARLLKDGFVGIFSIAKSLADIFVRLAIAISNNKDESRSFTDIIIKAIFYIGQLLEEISEWLDESQEVQRAIQAVANGINKAINVIKDVINIVVDTFTKFIVKLGQSQSVQEKFSSTLSNIGKIFKNLAGIISGVIDFFMDLFHVTNDNSQASETFSDVLVKLVEFILALTNVLTGLIASFTEWLNTSPGVQAAFEGLKEIVSKVISAISRSDLDLWDSFINVLDKISEIDFSGLAQNVKDAISKVGEFLGLGFLEGIDFDSIVQAAKNIANRFLSTVKELFGIHSPSTEMEDVGDNVIQGFLNGISKGLGKITESAKSLLDSFWAGLSGSTDGSDVANELEEDQERINPTLDWITNKLIPTLTKNLGGVVALAGSGGLLYVLLEIAKSFRKITTALDVLGSVRILASSYAKDLRADAFKKTAEGIAIGVLAITAALVVLSKADPQGLARATYALGVVGTALVATMIGLMSGLEKVKTAESALNTVAIGFKKGIKNVTLAIKIDALAKAAKTLATTIGIVIADIVAIMLLYNHDKAGFDHALTVVAEIAAAIMGAVAIMSLLGDKLQKGTASFAKIGIGALALSLAVLAAIKALKAILDLNFDFNKVEDTNKLMLLVTLFGLVGALALAIGGASRIAGKGGLKTGPLLAMCLMIVSAVYALKEVMEFKLDFGWEKKLKIFNNIFIALGGLILAIGVASALSENGLKGTGAILAMCAFIATAIAAIGILAIFPEEAFRKGATSLGIILGMLALTLVFISKSFNENAGRTVLGMAILIASIVASLAALSFVDKSTLLPAAISLGLVLLAVAVVFAAVGQIANEKSWGVVLSMVAVIAGVVAGLYVLSRVDSWENLIAAAIAMGTVLLAIAGAFKIINESKSPDLDHIMEFIVGVLGAAAIAMILRMLSDIPWETLIAAAGSISGVLLSIAGAFAIINKTNEIGPDKILAFISGCLVALTVGLVLRMCAGIPWETLIATAGSIAGLLIAMGVAFAIMNGTNFNLDSAGMMIAGCIAVGAIGMALAQAATQDWQSLLAAGVSISIVLLALAIAMNIVSIAGEAAKAALLGIGLLDAFILDLTLVLYGLSKLADADVLKDGAEKLGMIGKALGDFVGSIIEGIGEGVGRALEAIGTSLSNFMTNAQPFFDGLDQMDDSKVKAASALAGLVLALSAAEFLDGITNLLSVFTGHKDITAFGQKLVQFGEAMTQFDEATTGVNAARVKNAAEAAAIMIDIANKVPKEDGWAQAILGKNDIASFGKKLAEFGPSLADFDESIASVSNTSKYKDIADAVYHLVRIAQQVPAEEGVLQRIMGKNDIASFGRKLSEFAESLVDFDAFIPSISNTSRYKDIADGTAYLINIAKLVPPEDGFFQKVFGSNDIGEFGRKMAIYGEHIAKFDENIRGISNVESWSSIASGTGTLLGMVKIVNEKFSDSLKDKNTDLLVNFSSAMIVFGRNMFVANTYIQDISEERFAELSRGSILLINMCKKLVDTLKTDDMSMPGQFGSALNTYAYWLKSFNIYMQAISEDRISEIVRSTLNLITMCIAMGTVNNDTISNFGKAMAEFAKNGLTSFISTLIAQTALATSTIISSMNLLNTTAIPYATIMSSTFHTIARGSMESYVRGIIEMTPSATAIINVTLSTLTTIVISNIKMQTAFHDIANRSMTAYIRGIVETTPSAMTAVNVALTALTTVVIANLDMQTAFHDLASRSVEAYVRGIADKTSDALDSVSKMIEAIFKEFDRYNDDFERVGENIGQGIRRGIEDAVDDVAREARDMAREARWAIEDELEIYSPSRVMREDGGYVGEGFALGIIDKIRRVKQAAIQMAQTPVDAVKTALDDIPELDPTITPIVDLTNVMDAAETINGMFSDALSSIGVNVTKASTSMTARQQTNNPQNIQNDDGSGNTNVTFIQNNNSPKALSRIDIYRQTRNQLAQFREAVERT